ncbi:hypothetical protein A2U01_0097326 [Trifolium medium]|nr:hypothetical protein [Trifolium medium]
MDFSVSATTGGNFSKNPRAPKQFGRTNSGGSPSVQMSRPARLRGTKNSLGPTG